MAHPGFATRLFLILTGCIAAAVAVSTLVDYQWVKRDILRDVQRLTAITVADTIEDMDSRIIAVESSTQMFARILSQHTFTENEMRLSESMDYGAQPWFREVRNNLQARWSEPYFDEGGGNVLMSTYSVPLFRKQGEESFFLGL